MGESAIEFWYDTIGRYMDPSSSPEGSCALSVPHRTLKGVKPLRLGAIDSFYIATREGSKLIGRIELPSNGHVEFVPTETTSARKALAQWLVNKAEPPFMIGSIGNASPVEGMTLTHSLNRVTFCEAGKSFLFDLQKVRDAVERFRAFEWKKDIAPTIHLIARFKNESGHQRTATQAKLKAVFAKNPGLREAIAAAKILPNSGEYSVLSWLNIEGKTDA